MPVKLMIVDDHEMIRIGIKSLLEDAKHITVVCEASHGREAIEKARLYQPDVIIMDIKMPEMNGIEATRIIKDDFPNIKVLAFSMYEEQRYIVNMLQAGASGYILKNASKDELIIAIKSLAEGGTYFSQDVASLMIAPYMSGSAGKPTKALKEVELTKRELEILKYIAEEMTNVEIAEKLNISPRTVDTHRRNLLHKLEVKNTAGLVKYAIQLGLIST